MFSGKNFDFSKKSLNKNPKFPKINELNGVLLMPTEPRPNSFPAELFYKNNPLYVLALRDPKIFLSIYHELRRQVDGIEMIASENMPSEAVLGALFSPANNKYAEGYPGKGKRYYGGCEFVDVMEEAARERAKKIFSARHANVQPHAGTQANQAAFAALMSPGETILSMHLDHGGHLSHGSPVNLVGQIYNITHYAVDRGGFIDYDVVRDTAHSVKPRVIVAGGSAYPRTIDFEKFRGIADEVNAYFVADIAHIAGLVAAGLHPSPIDFAHVTTTTTHKTLRGPRGGLILVGKDYDSLIERKGKKAVPLHQAIDSAVFPGIQGGPLEHVIGAKAVAFGEALNADETGINPDFAGYQRQVVLNAEVLAKFLAEKGYELSTGGTDNHLVLVRNPRGLSGLCAQYATETVGITTNKNKVPYDTRSAQVPSGLRLGTPALTTRGIREEGTLIIAEALDDVLKATSERGDHTPEISDEVIRMVKPRIDEICRQYPLYSGMLGMFEFIINDLNLRHL